MVKAKLLAGEAQLLFGTANICPFLLVFSHFWSHLVAPPDYLKRF